jgi:hypothetical protein
MSVIDDDGINKQAGGPDMERATVAVGHN